jgi:hypothetical protein
MLSDGKLRNDEALRAKAWKEIIGVLESQDPKIKGIVGT